MPLIPDWLVYVSMMYAALMGWLCSRKGIWFDPIFFLFFIPQAFMYILFDFFDIPVLSRAPFVRLSLFIIPAILTGILTWQYRKAK